MTITQLLEYFEVTVITHVPRNEIQEANHLAQIVFGYKMSKSRFQDIIEVRENMVLDTPPLREDILDGNISCDEGFDEEHLGGFEFQNLWGHEVFTAVHHHEIGQNQSWNTYKIQSKILTGKSNIEL